MIKHMINLPYKDNVSKNFKSRVVLYSLVSICIFVLHMLKNKYKISPNFIDFSIFYTAAQFTLSGNAVAVYDIDAFSKAIHTLSGYSNSTIPLAWLYQPYTLLFFVPLVIPTYFASLTIWVLLGSLIYIFSTYKYTSNKILLLPLIGFPGFWYNVMWGQLTFFLVALIALAFYYMYKKPALAALLLSIAFIKPHLIVACLLPLIVRKRWKVLSYTCMLYILYLSISIFVFPQQIWSAYQSSMHWITYSVLLSPDTILFVNLSAYNMFRLFDFSAHTSILLHTIVALLSVFLLYMCWHNTQQQLYKLQVAALLVVCILMTPYTLQYDFALIGISLAIYYHHALQIGWLSKYEPFILAFTWLSPAICLAIVVFFNIQISPIALLIFLISIYKRINLCSQNATDKGA